MPKNKTAAAINLLMWESMDSFMQGLQTIAQEETSREVISDELKSWWAEFGEVIARFPYSALPSE